ncbi:MAG: hypothetical protein R2828_29890 [Saprospiraceae bacterium]
MKMRMVDSYRVHDCAIDFGEMPINEGCTHEERPSVFDYQVESNFYKVKNEIKDGKYREIQTEYESSNHRLPFAFYCGGGEYSWLIIHTIQAVSITAFLFFLIETKEIIITWIKNRDNRYIDFEWGDVKIKISDSNYTEVLEFLKKIKEISEVKSNNQKFILKEEFLNGRIVNVFKELENCELDFELKKEIIFLSSRFNILTKERSLISSGELFVERNKIIWRLVEIILIVEEKSEK